MHVNRVFYSLDSFWFKGTKTPRVLYTNMKKKKKKPDHITWSVSNTVENVRQVTEAVYLFQSEKITF